jgi:serine protease Do
VVSGIERDSAVERAGMHRGDTIVSYDGEQLDDFSQLTEITRRHKVGDRVVLEVLRNGDLIPLEAQLSGWEESEPKPVAK